jgi:vitamin B12 transporter
MRFAIAGGLFLCSLHCIAQEDAVVITASRSAQLLRESIPHTTVLTEREIRESQAVDLPALLRREAGFEFVQNGGIGRTSGTFLRGTATGQSLVLVDGVRVADLNNGSAGLDQFMLDEIERVEIVRGNVSSLYGSGAIGGVIQVFTRRGRGAPAASVDASVGGEGDRRLRASYGGEVRDTRFSVTASGFETRGFSALRPEVSPTADPDRDGYRNQSLAASASHRLAAGHEAGFSYYSTFGRQEYDSAFALSPRDKQTANVRLGTWSAYVNNQLTGAWLSKLSLSEASNSNHDFTNGATNFRTQTRNRQITWQNDLVATPDHRFVAGLERAQQNLEGTIAYTREGRNTDAFFAGYNARFGSHNLQLNTRDERYSDLGKVRTHFAGYAFDLSERWRLFASQGTGFRAPTFNELFFPPIDLGGGFLLACNDPNLRPERARSSDAGVQYAAAGHLVKVAAFHSRITDLINPGCPPQNINQATIDGVEASYSGEWRGTRLKAAFTVQDPVQHTATSHLPLVRRASRFGSVSAARTFGPLQAGAEWLVSGPRPDFLVTSFTGERTELAGYGVVNATARYLFRKETSIGMRVDNVFDKDYSLTHGFNVQRRKATLSLAHQF